MMERDRREALIDAIGYGLFYLSVLAIILIIAGCATTQPEPDAAPADRVCLTARPPVLRIVYFSGTDDGCPAEFESCLGPDDARALLYDMHVLLRYSREAWLRCGPLDAETE